MREGVSLRLADMLLDVDNDKELDCEIERVSEGLPVRLSELETEGVIDGVVVAEPETLSEMVGDRVTDGDTELVERSVRDTDTVFVMEGVSDSLGVELEVWVGVTDAEREIVTEVETDGLGVDVIGGEGDVVLIIPEKW